MDDVKVHYNSSQPARVHALAYTQGAHIHVGTGQQKHLAHEAWHVVQQKQGRVQPTLQAYRVAINDNPGLEREADVMGGRANRASIGSSQRGEISDVGSTVKRASLTNGIANASQKTPIQGVFTGVTKDELIAIHNVLTQISPENVASFEELRDYPEELFDINDWLSRAGIKTPLQELIDAGSQGVGSKPVVGEASIGLGLASLSNPELAAHYNFLLQSPAFQQVSKRASGGREFFLIDSSNLSQAERGSTKYRGEEHAILVPSTEPGGAKRTEQDIRGRLLFEMLNAANRAEIVQKSALFKDQNTDPYIKAGYALATEWYEWVNSVEHLYLTALINTELGSIPSIRTWEEVVGKQPAPDTYLFSEYLQFEIGQDHTSNYDPKAKNADWKGKEIVGVVESQSPQSLVITPQQVLDWWQNAGGTKIRSDNPFMSLQFIDETRRNRFGDRITEKLVKDLTEKNDLETLRYLISGPFYPLAKWDPEAWTLFLDWNAKPDHTKVVA
jgi:hypothetical protein